jgi:HPt (histidine-containing phosphotransfer) domain-containing protein
MPEDRRRCLEAGMDDHLTKPVDWREVLSRLPSWIALSDNSPDPADLAVPGGGPQGFPAAPEEPGARPAELEGLAPQDVADIAAVFLATAGGTLDELREAAWAGDAARVAALAHRLAGSCATVGAGAAATLCRRVEDAARRGAVDAGLAELVERLDDEFRDTRRWVSALRG